MLDMINIYSVKNDNLVTVFLFSIINRFIEDAAGPTTKFNRDVTTMVNSRTDDTVKIVMVDMEMVQD
jgi:hypothetical protein